MSKHSIWRARVHCPLAYVFALTGVLGTLVGCGGPDLNTSSRGSTFDQGLSGSYSGYGGSGYGRNSGPAGRTRGVYPRIEGSFELPNIQGNPFDYTENDVMVTLAAADNRTVKVPAFYDGGKTWKVRYTPDISGRVQIVKVQLNGRDVQPEKFDRRDFDVSGSPTAGFVRRDPKDRTRFAYDNGNSYYPLGQNVAFTSTVVTQAETPPAAPAADKKDEKGKDDKAAAKPADDKSAKLEQPAAPSPAGIPAIFDKMGRAGMNWSRVWMSFWDGKSLDWPASGKATIGRLDLDAARRWDAIVDSAEKNGIRFQWVLQNHGEWSTRVDAKWDQNPWNRKNGGFLNTPDEFFSNSRASALTRAKYRYIIARWGCSPSILSWELFNEVESTDAVFHKHTDEVAGWHNTMAQFIRQQDPYRHLITSSSTAEVAALGRELDYLQPHAYVPDPIATVSDVDSKKLDRPVFYGEIGLESRKDEGAKTFLHRALWAGAMSDASGAPGWWEWQTVDKENLYDQFQSAGEFVRQSGMLSKHGLMPAALSIETANRGSLTLAPGGGWGVAKQTEFTVLPSGMMAGLSAMPSYLQGSAHRSMFPGATLKADFPAAGTVSVQIDKVAKPGAHVTLTVDGAVAAEKEIAGGADDRPVDVKLETKVASGAHTIKLENSGADWARIRGITLAPYGPSIGSFAKSGKDWAALWLYARGSGEEKGKVSLSGLQNGNYKITWWDTDGGKVLSEETASVQGAGLTFNSPAFKEDVAGWVSRSNERVASRAEPKKSAPKKKATK